MVRNQGLDVDGGTVCNVTILGKPPWYVERMPGGVRGGGRKASAYSIEQSSTRDTSYGFYKLSIQPNCTGIFSFSDPPIPEKHYFGRNYRRYRKT